MNTGRRSRCHLKMSTTTTMSVPGIELVQINQREHLASSPTPSTHMHHAPHRNQNQIPSQDHNHTTEASSYSPPTLALTAHGTSSPPPIPSIRLTASTGQNHPSPTKGEGPHSPDGSVGNASLRQTTSGPPSPAPLSTQSTLTPPSISSENPSQNYNPLPSCDDLFPLSRIFKTDSIHYQRTRHLLGKVFSLTTIVVTLLGVFIYSMRAYVIAKWTSAKDFWEYCNSPSVSYTICD